MAKIKDLEYPPIAQWIRDVWEYIQKAKEQLEDAPGEKEGMG